jgi:hypothetical protein
MGHLPRMDVEFRQTFGGTLPPGFNVNLKTSGEPTVFDYEAPFSPVLPRGVLVKDVVFNLAVSLVVAILLALYIGLKM